MFRGRSGYDERRDQGGGYSPRRRLRPLARFFMAFHPVVRGLFVLAVVAAVAGGGYYFAVYRPEHDRRDAVSAGWREFDAAFQKGDEAALRAALDRLADADPPDPLAVRRRQALETLDADPADGMMTGITLRMALRAGDAKAADREAAKRLESSPKEWLSLCVRANTALANGDRAAADRFLDQLPAPTDAKAELDPVGLLFALGLFRAAGRDAEPLLSFVRVSVVPALKTPSAQSLPPPLKAKLLECYLEAFETAPGKPQPPGLSGAWAAAGRMFDTAADAALAAGDNSTLAALGRLTPRLAAGLDALHRDKQVTDDQYAPLRAEMADRGKKVWGPVLAKEPKNPEAYRSLALLKLRSGDYPGARETVAAGLTACGENPPLAALFATMLQAEDRPEVAAAVLLNTAEKHRDQVVWWVLAAEAAHAARRRDLALKACERGLAVEPGNPWLTRLEGRMWMDAGDPNRAVQRVRGLGPKVLAADPAVARVYARALVEAGLAVLTDDYLADLEKSARDRDDPSALAAALRGMIDAKSDAPDATLMAQAADRADRCLDRWPDAPELLRARGFALAQAAEFGNPAWPPARTRAAASALERVTARFPDDRETAAGLAWVRLKGQRNAAQALRDAAPLARADTAQPLPATQLEILGAVYLAADKPADAARVLEQARQTNPTARGFTLLARAYLAAGRPADARTALRAAAGLPQSAPDRSEYLEVARALEQEKS